MRTARTLTVLVIAIAMGCSAFDRHDAPGSQLGAESTGSIGIQLSLPDGVTISAVSYTLTNGAHTLSKAVDVSDAGVISFVVPGVPVGSGYTLTLNATSDNGIVVCSGQQPGITILNRATTYANVQMVCVDVPNQDSGGLLIRGVFDCCATWDTMVANPSTVPQGGISTLTANASGPCSQLDGGQLVSCGWSVVTGTAIIVNQYTDGTTNFYGQLVCPAGVVETETLQLLCSDGPLPDGGACPAWSTTGTVTVACGGM